MELLFRILECQKWMEKVEQGKKGKLYCGNRCRTRAYRRRKELRIISAFQDLDKFIAHNLRLMGKALDEGQDKVNQFYEHLNRVAPNKEVKNILVSTLETISANRISWATTKSIAEHLGIDENLLELDKFDDYYKEYLNTTSTMTYVDWDPNHKW